MKQETTPLNGQESEQQLLNTINEPCPVDQPQPTPPSGCFYTPMQIAVGTLLCTPLMGGFMMAHNYRLMKHPRYALTTWLVAIVLILMSIGAVIIFNEKCSELTPLPFVLAVGYYALSSIFQGSAINRHTDAGGNIQGWLRIMLITVSICVILFLAYFFSVVA